MIFQPIAKIPSQSPSGRKLYAAVTIRLAALLILSCAFSFAQAQTLRMQAGADRLASGTFGAGGHGGQYQVFIDNISEYPVAGLTLKTRLPDGISFVAGRGNGWACAASVAHEATCSFAQTLGPFQSFGPVTLWLDVAVGLAPPAGMVEFVSTIESTQSPLPPVPTCHTGISTSGCVRTSASVTPSTLRFF